MKKGGFFISNWAYLIWFAFYFFIMWVFVDMFTPNSWISLLITAIIYAISISLALCPIGEYILRFILGARCPATQKEVELLLPLFDEVYQSVQEEKPSINSGIQIFITNEMAVNACAFGRKSIAITQGALEVMNEDEIKGVLAHEFGHIAHGDTKALLLQNIGNGLFSIIIAIIRLGFRLIKGLVRSSDWIVLRMVAVMLEFTFNVLIFIILFIGDLILSLNSRKSEYLADGFAYRIGFGINLINALYLLKQMDMGGKMSIKERLLSSHPYLSDRIARLENQQM